MPWLRTRPAVEGLVGNLAQARHGACVSGIGVSAAAQIVGSDARGILVNLGVGTRPLVVPPPGTVVRLDFTTRVRRGGCLTSVVDAGRPREWVLGWPLAFELVESREDARWTATQLRLARFSPGRRDAPGLPLSNLSVGGLRVVGPVRDLRQAVGDRLDGWLVLPRVPPRAVGGLVRAVQGVAAGCVALSTEFFAQMMLDEAALRLALGTPGLA